MAAQKSDRKWQVLLYAESMNDSDWDTDFYTKIDRISFCITAVNLKAL